VVGSSVRWRAVVVVGAMALAVVARREFMEKNGRLCTDGGASGNWSEAELREAHYLGALPGYTKIRYRCVQGIRGGKATTEVQLTFTEVNGREVSIPALDSLGSEWSRDLLLEGWGLSAVKAAWDAMTPDGRPRVTMSFG